MTVAYLRCLWLRPSVGPQHSKPHVVWPRFCLSTVTATQGFCCNTHLVTISTNIGTLLGATKHTRLRPLELVQAFVHQRHLLYYHALLIADRFKPLAGFGANIAVHVR